MKRISPRLEVSRLREPTAEDPLRVLFSACVVGLATGWEGGPYTAPLPLRLARLPVVRATSFCPEHLGLGTPRPLTTLHDGDGRDVLAGRARVIETTGRDVTRELLSGVEAMRVHAREERIELAVLLEISDSCGSHALYLGPPEDKRYQRGTGVAAAALLDDGVPVIGQRDHATLGALLARFDPTFTPDPDAKDFVDQGWFEEYFGARAP